MVAGASPNDERTRRLHNALEMLAETGELRRLIEALKTIYDITVETREKLLELSARLEHVEARVEELARDLEDLLEKQSKIHRSLETLRKKFSRTEAYTRGLAEALLARAFLQELERNGYTILEARRNVPLADREADLVVKAKREGEEILYLVRVGVEPDFRDVGELLTLADIYDMKRGVRPQPVLAGVWIGSEVRVYALGKGVLVYRL